MQALANIEDVKFADTLSYYAEKCTKFCLQASMNKKAVLPQGYRAMPQVFFSVEVRQH